jgi:hypothetical protein
MKIRLNRLMSNSAEGLKLTSWIGGKLFAKAGK